VSRARTLLVASNDDFLESVTDWVSRDARFEVVGRAHSGAQALDQIDPLNVELVLVDVTLPDMNGFEVARRIKARLGAPIVILLSFFDGQAVRHEAWLSGADGVVAKDEMTERLNTLAGDLLSRRAKGPTFRERPANVIQPTGEDTGERGSS
jgi:DNA-binding NarL/FixJ family response regulator